MRVFVTFYVHGSLGFGLKKCSWLVQCSVSIIVLSTRVNHAVSFKLLASF